MTVFCKEANTRHKSTAPFFAVSVPYFSIPFKGNVVSRTMCDFLTVQKAIQFNDDFLDQ